MSQKYVNYKKCRGPRLAARGTPTCGAKGLRLATLVPRVEFPCTVSRGPFLAWQIEVPVDKIADSAQTEYCTTFHFPCVRPSVRHRRDISHFSHI